MNLKELNKELTDQDVEMRVQQVMSSGGMILLVYKTARVDANTLDRVLGAQNWSDEYIHRDGVVYCKVSIKVGDEWISKEDCGDPDMNGCKGTASDAFKRACFKWGIGRELYDYPFIWINLNEGEYEKNKNGKFQVSKACKFTQWSIKKVGNKISVLDAKGAVRFNGEISGGKGKAVPGEDDTGDNADTATEGNTESRQAIIQKALTGIDTEKDLQAYAKELSKQKQWNDEVAKLFTKRKEEILNGWVIKGDERS
jgi:hypothetical protein